MVNEIGKILELIGDKDIIELQNVIKNDKNHKLNNLLSYLIHNNPDSLEKAHLFRSVYGEVYHSSKDYLLRNELRLLKQALVRFLSGKMLTPHEHQLNFLKFLSQHQLTHMFRKEEKKLRKSLEKDGEIGLLEELEGLSTNSFYRNELRGSKEDFLRLNAGVQQWNAYGNENYLLQNRRLGVFQAFINEGFSRMGIDMKDDVQQMPFEEDQSTISKYYWYKAKSLSEADKIKYLNKALDYLTVTKMNPELKRDEFVVITNNLSLQYFFNRDYERAAHLYENLMDQYDLPKNKEVLVVFNYVSALVKCEKYDVVDAMFKLYYRKMKKTPFTKVKATLLYVMSSLSRGDLKKAKELLPNDLKQGSHDDYLYARLVWAIYYYLKSDMDSCERENLNLIQSIQSKSQFQSYLFCAQSMNAMLRHSGQKQLEKLHGKLKGFIEDKSIRHSDILPLLWLRNELAKQTKA